MASDEASKILQDLWYNVSQDGYKALRKEHVSVILEYGSPKEVAALIVNGFEEPRKHGDTTLLTVKKAEKIAEKYSKYDEYKRALVIASIMVNMEPVLKQLQLDYKASILEAIDCLKDYLERKSVQQLLENIVGKLSKKDRSGFEDIITKYNRCKTVRIDEYAGTGIKLSKSGINITGSADFLAEWKSRCEDVCSKGSVYKTYIKALRNWLLDSDHLECAPTDMIILLSNPKEELEVDGIPEEYTLRYSKDMEDKGVFLMDDDSKKASYPDYDIIPIFRDVEDMVTKNIIETLNKDSRL